VSDDKGKAGSAARSLARPHTHREAAAAAAALFLSRSMSHNVLRDYGPLATLSSSPLKKSTTGAVGCKWVAKINLLMQPGGRLPRPRARGLSNAHRQIENEKLIRPVRSICQRACQSNFCSLLGLAMGARGWLSLYGV
jgi:hypothetical protein